MSTTTETPAIQAGELTFYVRGNVYWKGKRYHDGDTIHPTEEETRAKNFAAWIAHGWVVRDGEQPPAVAKPAPRAKIVAAVAEPVAAGGADERLPLRQVPLDHIRPDPTQPRKTFSPEASAEMVQSIKDVGVLQAICVRPMSRWRQMVSFVARQWVKRERGDAKEAWVVDVPNAWASGIKISATEIGGSSIIDRLCEEGRIQFDPVPIRGGWVPVVGALAPLTGDLAMPGEEEWLEIVYGERRWRGSCEAKVTSIPARVGELDDIEAAELQGIENLKRKDLLPIEDAVQYRKLLDTPGYSMERLEAKFVLKRNTIYGKLKLLNLPRDVQAMIERNEMPASVGEQLGRKDGRVREMAIKAVLGAHKNYHAEGSKVPSDRMCQQIIKEVEEKEAVRLRWEEAKAAAVKKGITPLGDEEAAAEEPFSRGGEPRHASKYICAASTCYEHPDYAKWGKVLGKHIADVPKYLGRGEDGTGHVWMLRHEALAVAQRAGVELKTGGTGGGSGGGGDPMARERARQKAEQKKRKLKVDAENAGLAEIVATVARRGAAGLPASFWRMVTSVAATDCWADTTRRISMRRATGAKGGKHREALVAQLESADANHALALLTEIVLVGMRGSSSWGDGVKKHVAKMRGILGLKPETDASDADSADVGTDDEHELEDAA